jgi:hypothetical protein
VGLVQNQVEEAGVATVSMTVQPHITASVGVPRAVYLRFPAGNQMGEAGKPQQQRAILIAALEAAWHIQSPGGIVELPYRWRRFPIEEVPVFMGASQGPRHLQAEAIGLGLDAVVRQAREYRVYLEGRLAQEEANPAPIKGLAGLAGALRAQISRVDHLIEVLDTQGLDALREVMNTIVTLELRAGGKFV